MSAVEDIPGWSTLSEADQCELKRFEAFLKARAEAQDEEAPDTYKKLYEKEDQ